MKIFTRGSVILVIFSVIVSSAERAIKSPCNDVFTYVQDDNMRWFGKVKIPSADVDTILKLSVVLSLKMPPLSLEYEGHIELLDDPKVVYENIVYERLIQYKVVFPLETVPSISSVTFNGINFCSGVPPKKLARIIHLEHLRIFEDDDEEQEEILNTTHKPKRRMTTSKPKEDRTAIPSRTTRRPLNLNPGKLPSKSERPTEETPDGKEYEDDILIPSDIDIRRRINL